MRRVIEIDSNFKGGGYSSGTKTKPAPKKPVVEEFIPTTTTTQDELVPLELIPTLRTLKGYGKRMNALGALRGARALERVVEGLMPHIRQFPELVDVILEAKHEAEAIRSEALQEANGEQDDNEEV